MTEKYFFGAHLSVARFGRPKPKLFRARKRDAGRIFRRERLRRFFADRHADRRIRTGATIVEVTAEPSFTQRAIGIGSGLPDFSGTKMRAIRIRITDALHNRNVSFVVERFYAGESWIERNVVVDLEDLIRSEPKPRPSDVISVIGVGNDHVESVVATRHLQHHQNRSVFARDGLRRGVGCQRVEREESFFEEYRKRPAGGRAEHRGAQKFPSRLQCRFRFHFQAS